ncbi:metal-transporting ATPase [Treponema sp.]|uniref:metal-transporting ATPase n=1 Tax=Treponema sp. TaxID=166 RepID=UPI00388EC2BF
MHLIKPELLQFAFHLEVKSEHPLAKAVCRKAVELKLNSNNVENFKILSGYGLEAVFSAQKLYGGSLKFIAKTFADSYSAEIPEKFLARADELSLQGKTPLAFALEDKFLGIIAVSDTLKEDSAMAIQNLQKMGLQVVLLTGDNEETAQAVADQTGVNEVISGVLPEGKENIIRKFKQKGKVAMVGDGINDSPSLVSADIGIAVGNGTDVAIDAADVVVMKSSLSDVVAAINLSRFTLRNIHENLFWAFFYNIILIPVAAGAWYKVLGLTLNPMLAAFAMSLSSFCVVTNALRLNIKNIHKIKKSKKIKNLKMEEKMEKTIKVEGMMCSHCEKHVKDALEKIDGVKLALPSHEQGEVKLELSKEVASSEFEKAVTEAGYKFIG